MTRPATPLSLRSYGLLMRGFGLALPLYLRRRLRKGKEHPQRITERYGRSNLTRPLGDLIWMHAASVGESVMLLPLIDHLRSERPDLHILVTTGTVTSADIMAQRLPAGVIHQFLPADTPRAVKRFLKHWQPGAAIWAESELWPNLIRYTHKRRIPMVLLNARLSEKSLAGWAKRQPLFRALLDRFDLIMPADSRTKDGLTRMTDTEVTPILPLKDAAAPLDADKSALDMRQSQIGSRPVWVAASTHDGEDEIVLNAHKALSERLDNPLLILAPRHPERCDAVAKRIKATGFKAVRLSTGKAINDTTQILLIDGMGHMGLAYRLSHVALMCGSLRAGLSGHNPLEPARLNCAVLSGPHISSFEDIYRDMGDAVVMVSNGDAVASAVKTAFTDAQTLSARAAEFASGRAHVLGAIWSKLEPHLPPVQTKEDAL